MTYFIFYLYFQDCQLEIDFSDEKMTQILIKEKLQNVFCKFQENPDMCVNDDTVIQKLPTYLDQILSEEGEIM